MYLEIHNRNALELTTDPPFKKGEKYPAHLKSGQNKPDLPCG
jgi:hypothetical protein